MTLSRTVPRRVSGARKAPSIWSPRYRRYRAVPHRRSVRSGRGRQILSATLKTTPHRVRHPVVREVGALPEPLSVDRAVLARFDEASEKEWLETNGLGGYALSTAVGANTRRYHGLLVVPHGETGLRYVMVAKVEETLRVGGRSYDLSCNRYPGVVHPEGHLLLREFRVDPIPTYVYEVAGVVLEKKVFMLHGAQTVAISYQMRSASASGELVVSPMIAARSCQTLALENYGISKVRETRPDLLLYRAYPDVPLLYFSHDADVTVDCATWYRQFEYDKEAARGCPFREDLFVPFRLSYTVRSGKTAALLVSTEDTVPAAADVESLEAEERNRRAAQVVAAAPRDTLEASLVAASGDFLITGKYGRTGVVSGYHWFGEHSRDALISLPGLTLVTGRFRKAREILSTVSQYFCRGMLPSGFDERTGTPEYTSADASLWFIWAVHRYLSYTSDYEFVRDQLYGKMVEAIEYYRKGNGRGVVMARDGLLEAGTATKQMTWMNASVGGEPVTPRHGKAVEVCALWYNALKVVADIARRFDDDRAHRLATLATVAKRSFSVAFWNEERGCLYDCIRDGEADASVRPNQIFAVSLPYATLEGDRAVRVVDCVQKELLTPFGLRTLSSEDPRYHGKHEGDTPSRDRAYHQGTVWAWLLGPFITAYVGVHGRTPARVDEARGFIEAFRGHLRDAGLGTISELFDGDPPHRPGGCIASALSVAELLRAYRETCSATSPEVPVRART